MAADYFYGSPGADLTGQVEASVQAAEHPFKGLEEFSFGLAQEPFLPKSLPAQDFTTDDKGRPRVTFPAGDAPDTTMPLQLALHASVNDVDGRPAQADLTKVLHTADRFIGLRATFADGLADGADATFDVAVVDGDGKPLGADGRQVGPRQGGLPVHLLLSRRTLAVEGGDHRRARQRRRPCARRARARHAGGAGDERPLAAGSL